MCSAGIFLECQSKKKFVFFCETCLTIPTGIIQVSDTATRHLLKVSVFHSLFLCYQIIQFYLIYFLNKLVTTKNNKNTYKK
jgi:hypothetical protein